MKLPNRKRMLKIGISLLVLSIVVFSVSSYFITDHTRSYNEQQIAAGASNPYRLSLVGVSQGDDLEYSISASAPSVNLTVFWSSPSGQHLSDQKLSSNSTVTSVIIAPESGNWTLSVVNNGSTTVNATISIGDISYSLIYSVVIGFVLLPAGIAFIALFFYVRRIENKMKQKMERELR
ncbi:MAG: hypothetical protein QW597_04055 [Thermoplasmataceae archaeon]